MQVRPDANKNEKPTSKNAGQARKDNKQRNKQESKDGRDEQAHWCRDAVCILVCTRSREAARRDAVKLDKWHVSGPMRAA